jgi:hypothetical protein
MITKRLLARASAERVQIMLSPAIQPPRFARSRISFDPGSPICRTINLVPTPIHRIAPERISLTSTMRSNPDSRLTYGYGIYCTGIVFTEQDPAAEHAATQIGLRS